MQLRPQNDFLIFPSSFSSLVFGCPRRRGRRARHETMGCARRSRQTISKKSSLRCGLYRRNRNKQNERAKKTPRRQSRAELDRKNRGGPSSGVSVLSEVVNAKTLPRGVQCADD